MVAKSPFLGLTSLSRLNWALIIGLLITGVVVMVAFYGPGLAWHDPLQENPVFLAQGDILRPPLRIGQLPEFPLGTDSFGRDLFSRLLWAVRPTLTLVMVVAAIRLVVGLAVGVISGWFSGPISAGLIRLTETALLIPPLFTALLVIAVIGPSWGVNAFILGLAMTGWAEPARLIRDQTRLVRQARYIEAAEALGASPLQILVSHVTPQLLPFVWVLLAIEASSALFTVGGLGVLGYFINAVWLPTNSDFAAQRATGYPELAQMLNTDFSRLQPTGALLAGTLIVVMILGFNVLGAGLDRALRPGRGQRVEGRHTTTWLDRVQDRGFLLLAEWQRTFANVGVVAVLFGLIIGGSLWLWAQTQQSGPTLSAVQVPGGHLWSGGRHDPSGTLVTNALGPRDPTLIWRFSDATTSSPAIDATGNVYILSGLDPTDVVALSPDGQVLWRARLPVPAGVPPNDIYAAPTRERRLLFAPALTAEGDIVVIDETTSLYVFDAQGDLRWTFANPNPLAPLFGPTVSYDGTIYVSSITQILAVTGDGQLRWQQNLPTFSAKAQGLRLSPDGRFLLYQNFGIDAATGYQVFQSAATTGVFSAGADGQVYLLDRAEVSQFGLSEAGAFITPTVRLDERTLGLNFRRAVESGASASGRPWVYYGSEYEQPLLVWADQGGQVTLQVAPQIDQPALVAIDPQDVSYWCSRRDGTVCESLEANGRPLWQFSLPEDTSHLQGVALANGRLYVSTDLGLFVVGDE